MAVVAIVAIAGQTWLPSRTRTAPVVRHVSPTVSILHQCTPMDRGKEGRKESLLPTNHRLTVPCLADIQPAIAEREDRGGGKICIPLAMFAQVHPPIYFTLDNPVISAASPTCSSFGFLNASSRPTGLSCSTQVSTRAIWASSRSGGRRTTKWGSLSLR